MSHDLETLRALPPAARPGPEPGARREPTVQGQLLLAARYQPGTVTELAARMRRDVAEVLAAAMILLSEGELERLGRRKSGEVVLRTARSLSPVDEVLARVLETIR